MELEVLMARWQFALTIVYHWFFVPLTLGLSIFIAILETMYVRTGKEVYLKMTKFWGKLFLINFSMGLVTGIVIEFQFGMNWAEYSRYVGDIFGAPLAIEALVAFFMESTFLGIWIFGWDKISKKWHAVTIWLVALGSNLSAFWILTANSFMQEPRGYIINELTGRAELTRFSELIFNERVWLQFSHVLTSAIATAGFFVIGIAAWHFMQGERREMLIKSFRMASLYAFIGVMVTMGIGHMQGQNVVNTQPMKMAAAEGLWETEQSAPFSLFKINNMEEKRGMYDVAIPGMLSFMAYNDFNHPVQGINDLQKEFEAEYGPGNYIPPVNLTFWTFRVMVGVGSLMALLSLIGYWKTEWVFSNKMLTKIFFLSLFLPYIGQATGWVFTEMGRMPWAVYGLLKVEDAVSKAVSPFELGVSLFLFTLIYSLLIFVDVYLLKKHAQILDVENVNPVKE